MLLGSFSSDDGNGSENVSIKMKSRFFNLILPDDGGGRVCQGCTASEFDYILTLFTYSCYTDRRSLFRGDALFVAAQTLDHQTVTIEFPRVPYRLYLTPSDFRVRTLSIGFADGTER